MFGKTNRRGRAKKSEEEERGGGRRRRRRRSILKPSVLFEPRANRPCAETSSSSLQSTHMTLRSLLFFRYFPSSLEPKTGLSCYDIPHYRSEDSEKSPNERRPTCALPQETSTFRRGQQQQKTLVPAIDEALTLHGGSPGHQERRQPGSTRRARREASLVSPPPLPMKQLLLQSKRKKSSSFRRGRGLFENRKNHSSKLLNTFASRCAPYLLASTSFPPPPTTGPTSALKWGS